MANKSRRKKASGPAPGTPSGAFEPAPPCSSATLAFRPKEEIDGVSDRLAIDISAAALAGRCLFVANDETASVERLVTDDWRTFTDHDNFALGAMFDLPGGDHGEMDIEGLAADDGFLWIVGSHSLTRDKPEREDNTSGQAFDNLLDIDRDANRFFLGRVPLVAEGGDGLFRLADARSDPAADHPFAPTMRTAAALKLKATTSALVEQVGKDEVLAPFLDIPSKENGFDVEGIAVRGDRVAIGLRGPVLRGWACIIEMRLKLTKPHRLKMRRVAEDGARLRKHFVRLDGLGIRDLKYDGDDLLILAGPSMDLDGPAAIYRWPGWAQHAQATVLHPHRLERWLGLPVGVGCDHPEAVVPLPGEDAPLMVIHDSPAPGRLDASQTTLRADLYDRPRG